MTTPAMPQRRHRRLRNRVHRHTHDGSQWAPDPARSAGDVEAAELAKNSAVDETDLVRSDGNGGPTRQDLLGTRSASTHASDISEDYEDIRHHGRRTRHLSELLRRRSVFEIPSQALIRCDASIAMIRDDGHRPGLLRGLGHDRPRRHGAERRRRRQPPLHPRSASRTARPGQKDQRVAAKFCDSSVSPATSPNSQGTPPPRREKIGTRTRCSRATSGSASSSWTPATSAPGTGPRRPRADALDSVEHLKTDRTEQDILYELLLKLGLDLCVPIETRTIAGKEVHAVGAGTLMACLARASAATTSRRWPRDRRWPRSSSRPATPPSCSATAPSPTMSPRPTWPPSSSSTAHRCGVVGD